MAGGKFDKNVGKVRPGTYINFESGRSASTVGAGSRGTTIIPLPKADYGPAKQFIKLTNANPDAAAALLGYSVYDSDPNRQMLLLREAFKRASTVYVYILGEGTKATAEIALAAPAEAAAPTAETGEADGVSEPPAPAAGAKLTATAKHGGSRGNAYTVTVDANPLGGYDVLIHLGGNKVWQREGLTTIGELAAQDNPYIVFSGEGALGQAAGANLAGGTDAKITNGDITTFIDAWETVKFDTVAFPFDGEGQENVKQAARTKIKYMRDNMGKNVQVVIPDASAPDFEGVINVTNSIALDGVKLTHAEACAWVAAASAAATRTQSLTNVAYEGAVAVVDPKTNDEAIAAIKNGEFFFSVNDEGAVVVEYDINSLVSYTEQDKKDKSYTKNRVIRVLDSLRATIHATFPPGKFDNDPEGWDIMDGLCKAILREFEDDGAIRDVDYDTDLRVNREESKGDETYFDGDVLPVDGSEKLHFSIKTR